MKRLLLLFIFVAAFGRLLLAQGTCTDVLRDAQQRFDDGLLGDVPGLIADCMKDGFTKEEKANAYKLLIQTYLFSEEFDKADEVMMDFLNEFPSYSLAPNDPTEFVNLYRTYRTEPIFKLEASLGLNFNIPTFLQKYSVANPASSEYYANPGINVEVDYVNTINENFDYGAGLSFAYLRLGYSDSTFDYTEVATTFTSMFVGVPLSLRYNYSMRFIDLYARVGLEPVYLINYKADITRTDEIIGREVLSHTEFLEDYHNRFDLCPFLGVGAKLDIGRDQLMLSLSYKFGILNQLAEDQRLKNLNLSQEYFTTEDNSLNNTVLFSFSYIRPIYNPKKIR